MFRYKCMKVEPFLTEIWSYALTSEIQTAYHTMKLLQNRA